MKKIKAIRSILYTTALNSNNYDMASKSGADVCLIDLEDSIPLNKKKQARDLARNFFRKQHDQIITAIRINNLNTAEGDDDLSYVMELPYKPDIVLLTKVDSPQDVEAAHKALATKSSHINIFLTIETVKSLFAIDLLAEVSQGFVFGSADLAAELCINIEWENMLYARQKIVLAAAMCTIPAIDTACFELHNDTSLKDESERAKSLGFTGKAAMHPSQVAIINKTFDISLDEISRAQKIVATYEKAGGGVMELDGQMIGPPFYSKAKRLLERFNK